MKRVRRREFVMFEHEAEDLRNKARQACMSESQLIRLLIAGYQPPPAPDDRFHEDMERLIHAAEELTEAAKTVNLDQGRRDVLEEVGRLRSIREMIMLKYLSGERTDQLWR